MTTTTRGPAAVVHRLRAMASEVRITLSGPTAGAGGALTDAEQVFRDVEATCTRFDPGSPLMRVNARPRHWQVVPPLLLHAVQEAAVAHDRTDGLFDPRVYGTLRDLGYDRSLPFADGGVCVPGVDRAAGSRAGRSWRPRFDPARGALRLGRDPIDLGGIGKGLAVRWAAERLGSAGTGVLVDAGGDCWAGGSAPDGDSWMIAVEDPAQPEQPLVVLGLRDRACATSSTRLRRWHTGTRAVHHLIDPRTGQPGGDGLVAVTVVADDPADAEVWSKALFLHGRERIRAAAERQGLAALWVDDEGAVSMTDALRDCVRWERPDGR